MNLNELDRVEILSLQDNYIDMTAVDDSDIVCRAKNVRDGEIRNSVQAEHGFSAFVPIDPRRPDEDTPFRFRVFRARHGVQCRCPRCESARCGAARPLTRPQRSHGRPESSSSTKIGKKGIDLVLHPAAFKDDRFITRRGVKDRFPRFSREALEAMGLHVVADRNPLPLLNGDALFLGEIPRTSPFEKGVPHAFFLDQGKETWDPIEEDSSVALNLGAGASSCCRAAPTRGSSTRYDTPWTSRASGKFTPSWGASISPGRPSNRPSGRPRRNCIRSGRTM